MRKTLQWIFRQFTDTHVVTPEEIEGIIKLPVVAIIPHLERRRQPLQVVGRTHRRVELDGRWRSRLLTNFPEDSPEAAAYNNLMQEIRTQFGNHQRNIFMVASSIAAEGGSLTSMNLALTASRQGLRTLIIEGHIRAPRISSVFHCDLEPGLTGCLNRDIPFSQGIRKELFPNVDILAAGRSVTYPGSLWSSAVFSQQLERVRSTYDLIFVEAAPLLMYVDTVQMARQVDKILLVHQFARGTTDRLKKAVEKLGTDRERVLGVVLNDAPGALR